MSFEALQERLAALQETTAQLRELIDRLAGLSFEPGSVPLGGDDEDNVAGELSAEIGQVLREEEEDLELLQEEITDLRSGRRGSEQEHDKNRLKEGARRLEAELRSCRVYFRRAQLAAKHSLEAARRLERKILLASYTTPSTADTTPNRSSASSPAPGAGQPLPRRHHHHHHHRQGQQPGRPEDPVAARSSDVTAALRRTHDLIASELARSVAAQQALGDSTAQLKHLHGAYGRLDSMLASSRDLVGTLLRSNKSDTWYLQTTLYLLAATAAWLVFRRLLYGPLWWLVWLPLRLALGAGWRAGTSVARAAGGAGGARMEVAGGDEGRATVVGMAGDDEALPTVRVGNDEAQKRGGADGGGSMLDKVGRIVDGGKADGPDAAAAGEQQNGTEEGGDQPNPKKRMWEEDKEAAKEAARAKDEL